MKHFAIFHEIQDLLLGWISVANRAIPVNLEFDRRRRFEEVSMPFVFRTARALSALGSPASVRAFVAAVAALSIAAQTVAAAEATSSENSIE
jgi:Tfp pilus assembly protein PilO